MKDKIRMKKILGHAITLNQKWYLTLCVAILLNIGWNFINTKESNSQDRRITDLEKENLELKKTNLELLSKNFLGQRILDKLPWAIWKKKKSGDAYIMKFLNNAAKDQFLKDKGIDRYNYFNQTDFAFFPYSEARKFYVEDSIVAYAKTDTIAHFDTNFYDATGKIFIKDGYTRWREIVEGDTLIWGKMDKFFITEE